jgi:phosphohistidine phosphatase
MDLYLIRHAEAEPRGGEYREESRPLTSKGARQFRAAAAGMKKMGVRFDRLLFSPWLRAAATADFLVPLVEGESEATLLLAKPPTRDILKVLSGNSVAVVGHQPWLGELLGWLVFNDMYAGVRFEFDKGGVAILQGYRRPGGMVMREFLRLDDLTRMNA